MACTCLPYLYLSLSLSLSAHVLCHTSSFTLSYLSVNLVSFISLPRQVARENNFELMYTSFDWKIGVSKACQSS